MQIGKMFDNNINRLINGVIQVGDDKEEIIKQEVTEYVITSELQKLFNQFF